MLRTWDKENFCVPDARTGSKPVEFRTISGTAFLFIVSHSWHNERNIFLSICQYRKKKTLILFRAYSGSLEQSIETNYVSFQLKAAVRFYTVSQRKRSVILPARIISSVLPQFKPYVKRIWNRDFLENDTLSSCLKIGGKPNPLVFSLTKLNKRNICMSYLSVFTSKTARSSLVTSQALIKNVFCCNVTRLNVPGVGAKCFS